MTSALSFVTRIFPGGLGKTLVPTISSVLRITQPLLAVVRRLCVARNAVAWMIK